MNNYLHTEWWLIEFNLFSSPEMKGLSDKERQALELKKEDDGEFWMSFKDFKQHYTTVSL